MGIRAIRPKRDYCTENLRSFLKIAKTQLHFALMLVGQDIAGAPRRGRGKCVRSLLKLSDFRQDDTEIETRLYEIRHELRRTPVGRHRIGQASLILVDDAQRIQKDRIVGSHRERLPDQLFRLVELATGMRHQAKPMQCLGMAGRKRQGAKTISLRRIESARLLVGPSRCKASRQ